MSNVAPRGSFEETDLPGCDRCHGTWKGTPYSKYPLFLGYDVDPLLKRRYLPWKIKFFKTYPEKSGYLK